MKKALFIFAAIITCSVYSCKKNEIELLEQPIIQNIDDNLVKYTFTAVVNDKLTDADTKASVSRAGAFSWQQGDELVFYTKNGDPATAEITKVDGSVATITVTTDNPRSDFYSAIYPAEAASAKNKVSFNARGPIVVSAVDGGTLTFYHIGSLINVKFTNIPSATQSVVFAPKTTIGYDGTFDFSDRVPSLSFGGAINEIVVPASQDDENKDITICLPSVTLTDGFSVALNANADGAGRNLFKKSTAIERNLSTGRPVLLNMKKVAYEAPKMIYITTKSSTTTYDLTKAPLIYNGSNYASQINCDENTDIYLTDDYNEEFKFGHVNGGNYYSIYADATSQGVAYISSTLDGPWGWGDSNFSNEMYVMGPLVGDDSWESGSAMSYKNHIWTLTGINITSTDTQYTFKFKRYDDWWQNSSGTLNKSTMHGSAYKYGTMGDQLKKTFSQTGIYTLYANAVSGESNPIRFMFVRTGDLPSE